MCRPSLVLTSVRITLDGSLPSNSHFYAVDLPIKKLPLAPFSHSGSHRQRYSINFEFQILMLIFIHLHPPCLLGFRSVSITSELTPIRAPSSHVGRSRRLHTRRFPSYYYCYYTIFLILCRHFVSSSPSFLSAPYLYLAQFPTAVRSSILSFNAVENKNPLFESKQWNYLPVTLIICS